MQRTPVVLALVLTLSMTAACSSGGGGTPGQPGEPNGGQAADGGDGGETLVVSPEAELEGSCEPLPQRGENGPYVSADLVVRNTGNIGVVVRVVSNWRQPGGRHLTASKRLRLELDESQPVKLRIDIQPSEARAIRRMVRRDRPCYTRVRVAGAFGEPRQ